MVVVGVISIAITAAAAARIWFAISNCEAGKRTTNYYSILEEENLVEGKVVVEE